MATGTELLRDPADGGPPGEPVLASGSAVMENWSAAALELPGRGPAAMSTVTASGTSRSPRDPVANA